MTCDQRSVKRIAKQFKPMPILADYAPQPRRKPSLWRVLSGVKVLGISITDWAVGIGCIAVILACACLP